MSNQRATLPSSSEFIYAVLDYADKRNGEFHRSEPIREMGDYFNLTPEVRNKRTRQNNKTCVDDRTSWALSNLKNAKLLVSNKPGYFEITNLGREKLATADGEISRAYLLNLE